MSIKNKRVCVVGLGYVGFPLIQHLSNVGFTNLTGYDENPKVIESAKAGKDHTGMIPEDVAQNTSKTIKYTYSAPPKADIYLICVPTPDRDGQPDYSMVEQACVSVGWAMDEGAYVIIESTVGPGTTERLKDVLRHNTTVNGFTIAHSPERVNPGPEAFFEMRLCTKTVSVTNPSLRARHELTEFYGTLFNNVRFFDDTRVTELGKCFENSQRDTNIALMNELSQQCHKHGIDFREVHAMLRTKPRSPNFTSGLVGGHCIPVDPYYLAEFYDKEESVVSFGRAMNDQFISFVASLPGAPNPIPHDLRILILGTTYKRDVFDLRNSGSLKVRDILKKRGFQNVYTADIHLDDFPKSPPEMYDYVIGAVNHTEGHGNRLIEYLPLAIDCTFLNIDKFTNYQTNGIRRVIHL